MKSVHCPGLFQHSYVPSCLISGFSNRHLRPCFASSTSGSCMIAESRGACSKSKLFSRSFLHCEICWFVNTRAAEIGMVLLKKARSRVRMVRFTGGRIISSSWPIACRPRGGACGRNVVMVKVMAISDWSYKRKQQIYCVYSCGDPYRAADPLMNLPCACGLIEGQYN